MKIIIIKIVKFFIIPSIIAIPFILLSLYIMKTLNQHHYRPIPPIIEYGIVDIKHDKFIYLKLDMDATIKTFGTTVVIIGMEFNNDATLDISAISKYGLLRDNNIRFITSPIVLIPEYYFIAKETIITTGIDQKPIFKVKKENNILKIDKY